MPDFKQNIPPYGRAEKQGVPQLQTKFKRHFLKQNVYVMLKMPKNNAFSITLCIYIIPKSTENGDFQDWQ